MFRQSHEKLRSFLTSETKRRMNAFLLILSPPPLPLMPSDIRIGVVHIAKIRNNIIRTKKNAKKKYITYIIFVFHTMLIVIFVKKRRENRLWLWNLTFMINKQAIDKTKTVIGYWFRKFVASGMGLPYIRTFSNQLCFEN